MAFMLSDIRKYDEPIRFQYMLMKPDGYMWDGEKYQQLYYELGYIEFLTDKIHFQLSGVDELELVIPRYSYDSNFQTIDNYAWVHCKCDYVIEIGNNISDEKQRFLVTNIEKNYSTDGKITKTITAHSLEKEFESKMLRQYKSIDNDDPDIESTMYLKDILDNLNKKYMDNTWSVGFIDANVATRRRSYDFTEGSVLRFHGELQTSFCCLFKYDTINRKINVYDYTIYPVCPKCHRAEYLMFDGNTLECYNPECTINDTDGNVIYNSDGTKANWVTYLFGRDTGLYLSEKNYISAFEENVNIDNVATRLYVYGKDDLQINTADENYAGQSYIEDFSFFRNKTYMTDELLRALNKYDELFEKNKGIWTDLNNKSWELKQRLSIAEVINPEQKSLLNEMEYEISVIRHLYAVQANDKRTETIKNLKEKIEAILVSNSVTEKVDEKCLELLEKMNIESTAKEDDIINISEKIKILIDDFESRFMNFNADDLSGYSLEQLQEAANIYDKRISALDTIQKNISSVDVDPDLTLGKAWSKGDVIIYNAVKENIDDTAEVIIADKNVEITSDKINSDGVISIEISPEYNSDCYNSDNVHLQVWIKKGGKGDRVLQTENAHYYVVSNVDGTYSIVQNSVDLLAIKKKLDEIIAKKQKEVDGINAEIDANNKAIEALKDTLDKKTCVDSNGKRIFPDELILELNKYIKELTYTNSDIGVADITDDVGTETYRERVNELYRDARTVFYTKSVPNVTFNIDVINFLRCIECQHNWDKLSLGDMIHIGHSGADNPNYIVRIIALEWSSTDTKINITLSNESKFKNGYELLDQLMKNSSYASKTIAINKDKWNNAQSNAVDEILGNAFNAAVTEVLAGNYQDVKINEKGITIINGIDRKKQMRMMDGLITFTLDNWNTTRTAISNGYIYAENIIGRMLVGKTLHIIATKADGTTMTFRVDGEGVLIDNGSLTIKDVNGSGNNVNIDPKRGIVVTQKDAKTRVIINAKDGLCIQKGNGNGTPEDALDSENWNDKPVYIKTNGDAVFGGDIHAKRLFLDELKGENIVTYIDRGGDHYSASNTYDPDADEVKLSGEFLEGRGLKAYDSENRLRVEISGKDGSLSMYNGYIEMEDDNGNSLYIDPEDFLVWIVDGKKKFYYDKESNSLKFEGTIDTKEDGIFGANLTIGNVTEKPEIHLAGMYGDICTIKSDGGGDKSTTIDTAGHLILKSSLGAYLGSADTDNRIVTQGQLKDILRRLKTSLKSE